MDSNRVDLSVWEVLGTLTLAVHHLRGRISWMLTSGAVKFPDVVTLTEFERHDRVIAELEETLWEIVPPRALLLALRRYRLTGEMEPEIQKLLEADYRGRVPYSANPLQLEEILKRIADIKSYDGGEIVRD